MKIQKPLCQLNSKSISNSFRLLCYVFAVHSCLTLSSLSSQRSLSSLADDMVLVEQGSFIMGGVDGRDTKNGMPVYAISRPNRMVNLPNFYVSKYEVTQQLWQEVMGKNPSYFNTCGALCPVETVSWYDCIEFCNKLSILQGLEIVYLIDKTPDPENGNGADLLKWQVKWNPMANGYRLPCEAEWEFAARGGNKSKSFQFSGSDDINKTAWYNMNSTRTQTVAQKQPNELGLFDMSGNVFEWNYDFYKFYGGDYLVSKYDCFEGNGTYRTIRGGSWSTDNKDGLICYRNESFSPSKNVGLRIFRSFK
jgi:sulfatase modifying factor 1